MVYHLSSGLYVGKLFHFTFKTYSDDFQNSIRAHVGHTFLATVQNELDHAVDYRSKWSTKFHKDCKVENYSILLLRDLLMIFIIFTIVLGRMSSPQHL